MRVTYGAGFAVKPVTPMRERVARLEQSLIALPQVDCPVRHYFAPGLFAREITIEAGVCLVGAVHRVDNIVTVSMGCLRLATEDGFKDVSAGETFTCKAGSKNAAIAIERTRWTNFYPNPTDETSIDVLAEMFTESKASELLGGADNKQIAANRAAEIQGG